jgi:uncharacterized protein YbjT (DUF2867 family)
MTKLLITGPTGNVGLEVIRSLQNIDHQLDVYAGVRDVDADKARLSIFKTKLLKFDFLDSSTYKPALDGCDILFLLRPPQIADVGRYFAPLIATCKEQGVKHIVFLSVQGVERSRIIPHYKIEQLIVNSNIPYTFLRPAYFMQNFLTTLRGDLVLKKRIYLPAGNAAFTLIDVRDIGLVSANILTKISEHRNKSYELTSKEKLTFSEMARTLSYKLKIDIQYISPSPLSFFLAKKREKEPTMLVLVMIMLHYLPRFQKSPNITEWVEKICHQQPTTFEQFIDDHEKLLRE